MENQQNMDRNMEIRLPKMRGRVRSWWLLLVLAFGFLLKKTRAREAVPRASGKRILGTQ